eukprot:CAMPEP_0201694964 /NCGR_PEP_ID=MMETSP0578-20130828/7063_1 /ASSEMBLY_ACC=CAM_ASM_000663 /TAXON_ID=267565 /ORGANISM="Skeletonema grethea, Strain CCMP 1804" /LENGTH=622 /DNA_ID=CAMNT_0048180729 /DNA_START=139 /DNA_END=2010 /DNA_ORIENTATION=+
MKIFYIQAILTASIGGILYGYDMGVISGALPSLSAYFQLDSDQQEWVVALLYFGGGVGAATGGFICDLFGRKRTILITDVIFGLGAFLLSIAQSISAIMIGRCIVGWAVAVSAIADVAYLHEISSVWEEKDERESPGQGTNQNQRIRRNSSQSSNIAGGRGSVVSVNEACISLGFLMAYGVAYSVGESNNSEEWRSMFAVGGLLAIIQFIGMMFMPESPVWLHNQGRTSEAKASRNKIRGSMHDSSSAVEVEMATTPPSSGQTSTFTSEDFMLSTSSNNATNCIMRKFIRFCSIPRSIMSHWKRLTREMFVPFKRQCIISFFLATAQQFCGHPSVLNFAAEIFAILNGTNIIGENDNDMGAEEEDVDLTPMELTVGIGALKFLTTVVVILFVERVGRRPLLLSGMLVILISLTFLIVGFSGYGELDIQQQDQLQQTDISPSVKSYLGIIGIYGVAAGYAMSFGPLTWLITSELFSSVIRGRALGFATVITYVAAGIVSRTFLSLQNEIGLSKCFSLYWVATFISIVFVWLGVPETGNERTVDEIKRDIDKMWVWGGRRADAVNGTSWRSLRTYGSWGLAPDGNHADGVSPTPSSDEIDTKTDSTAAGLSPRRSSSSLPRQIV